MERRREKETRRGEARERDRKNFRCLSPQPECGSSEKEMGREWLPKTEYTYRFCCLFSEIKKMSEEAKEQEEEEEEEEQIKLAHFPLHISLIGE